MRPIEYRADTDFHEALRCVECRLPKTKALKENGRLLGLGLRYGAIGAAAVYHLLLSANEDEERLVVNSAISWPTLVVDHFRREVLVRLPFAVGPEVPEQIGRWAQHFVQRALPLFQRFYPLEAGLTITVDEFAGKYTKEIQSGWNLLLSRRAKNVFRADALTSVRYAVNFFERRQLDLQEVPEIALLDE